MKNKRLIKILAAICIIVVLLSIKIIQNVYAETPFLHHDNVQETATSKGPLTGKTIVLDPGHGGNDHGTTSIAGTPEKTLTLETAEVVKEKLEKAGAAVYMTRNTDTYVALKQRAKISNKNRADAFISFHYNWNDESYVNGVADYYYHSSRDHTLASDVLNEVAKATGLKNDGTSFNNLSVLRNNKEPSTLVELGFLSNSQEDAAVENSAYRNKVAEGVYEGLLDYFSSKKIKQ